MLCGKSCCCLCSGLASLLQEPAETKLSWLAPAGGKAEAGSIRVAIKFPGCANLDPVKYLQGLAKAVAARGGQIFENTRVKEAKNCIGAQTLAQC